VGAQEHVPFSQLFGRWMGEWEVGWTHCLPNGLVSLRIFRLLRIFQLVRLGQYNQAFTSLTNVLSRSVQYLRLLIIVLAFGAAFFGSMVYWMEKGT